MKGRADGYFLDRATWPVVDPAITLLDLNANCLRAASERIKRYAPQTVVANILDVLPALEPFSSAGLCYLLHCLPGSIAEKAIVFDHLRPCLLPGARVFGATIVQRDVPRSRSAQAVMNLYNRRGIFSNSHDTVGDLEVALGRRFTHHPNPAAPKVLGDRTQLQQVFVNLTVNAIQATAQMGTARRTLVIRTTLSDPRTLCCTLEDSGPGIKPEHLDHLFDSFFTTKDAGMGLGLRISRSIIEAYGGCIRADNESAHGGARFSFTLPAKLH